MYLLSLVILTSCLKLTYGVRCYTCKPEWDVTQQQHEQRLCQHFEYADKFMEECPDSTICFKKDVSLELANAVTTSTERGCAPQTLAGEQEKDKNGVWHHVKNIHEAYETKCSEEPNDVGRPTKTTFCYCRGDLCNSARTLRTELASVVTLIVGIVTRVLVWS